MTVCVEPFVYFRRIFENFINCTVIAHRNGTIIKNAIDKNTITNE